MNQTIKKIIATVILMIIYSAMFCLSLLIKNKTVIYVIGIIFASLLLIIIVANIVLFIKDKIKKDETKLVIKNGKADHKKINKMCLLAKLYILMVFITIYFLGFTVVYFIDISRVFVILVMLLAAFLAIITVPFIHFSVQNDEFEAIDKKQYPYIVGLFEKVAKNLNIKKDIIFTIEQIRMINILEQEDLIIVELNPFDLLLLNEKQLEAWIYYGLSSLNYKASKTNWSLMALIHYLDNIGEDSSKDFITSFFFLHLKNVIDVQVSLLYKDEQGASKHCEDILKQYNCCQDLVDAFVLIHCKNQFFDIPRRDTFLINNEKAPKNYVNQSFDFFVESLSKNEEMYRHFVECGLPRMFIAKPTIKKLMKNLNVSSYSLIIVKSDNLDYLNDVYKVVETYNMQWYEDRAKGYEKERQDNYLIYKQRIQEACLTTPNNDILILKKAGLDREAIINVLCTYGKYYFIINDYQNAKEYLNKALSLSSSKLSAKFYLALIYLSTNDERCEKLLIDVFIEGNKTYPDAYDYLMEYFDRNGLYEKKQKLLSLVVMFGEADQDYLDEEDDEEDAD